MKHDAIISRPLSCVNGQPDLRHASRQLMDLATSLLPIGAWSCEVRTDRLCWTHGVFDLFGMSGSELPDRHDVLAMYGEHSRELLENARRRAIETATGFTLDVQVLPWGGEERWIRITAATQTSNGYTQFLYGMKQDITQDRRRWDTLRQQAQCDPLTGIANRALFQKYLEQPKSEGSPDAIDALILLDLDDFKHLNDQWGHAAGDACLAGFAERLRLAFPMARLVARIGGDEFAVLFAPDTVNAQFEDMIRSKLNVLRRPLRWQDTRIPVRMSAGLALRGTQLNLTVKDLFLAADRALYGAKSAADTTLCKA